MILLLVRKSTIVDITASKIFTDKIVLEIEHGIMSKRYTKFL